MIFLELLEVIRVVKFSQNYSNPVVVILFCTDLLDYHNASIDRWPAKVTKKEPCIFIFSNEFNWEFLLMKIKSIDRGHTHTHNDKREESMCVWKKQITKMKFHFGPFFHSAWISCDCNIKSISDECINNNGWGKKNTEIPDTHYCCCWCSPHHSSPKPISQSI